MRLTFTETLPDSEPPSVYRVRAWLRSRNVARQHERTQLNTYFALAIVDDCLMHLADNFSPDYFIERVEHEAEIAINPGVFPHLSLGLGQRFASKGGYIVKYSETAEGGLEAASDWIVP